MRKNYIELMATLQVTAPALVEIATQFEQGKIGGKAAYSAWRGTAIPAIDWMDMMYHVAPRGIANRATLEIDELKVALNNQDLLEFVETAEKGEISVSVLYPIGEKRGVDDAIWSRLLDLILVRNEARNM